jgi:galactose mutarotase-like enzyme
MIRLENEWLQVLIDPTGGRLQSIRSVPDGLEYLWQKSKFPNMFPFVGRLFEKRYTANGMSYPMEMHGFLRNMEMTVISESQTFCVLEVEDTPETCACYPYSFRFRIFYRLEGKKVHVEFLVENPSERRCTAQ